MSENEKLLKETVFENFYYWFYCWVGIYQMTRRIEMKEGENES